MKGLMLDFLKKIASLVGVAILTAIVTSFLISHFPIKRLKYKLPGIIYKETGYVTKIDGDVKLELFPNLAFKVSNIKMFMPESKNASLKYRTYISADNLKITLSYLKVLKKQSAVRGIHIELGRTDLYFKNGNESKILNKKFVDNFLKFNTNSLSSDIRARRIEIRSYEMDEEQKTAVIQDRVGIANLKLSHYGNNNITLKSTVRTFFDTFNINGKIKNKNIRVKYTSDLAEIDYKGEYKNINSTNAISGQLSAKIKGIEYLLKNTFKNNFFVNSINSSPQVKISAPITITQDGIFSERIIIESGLINSSSKKNKLVYKYATDKSKNGFLDIYIDSRISDIDFLYAASENNNDKSKYSDSFEELSTDSEQLEHLQNTVTALNNLDYKVNFNCANLKYHNSNISNFNLSLEKSQSSSQKIDLKGVLFGTDRIDIKSENDVEHSKMSITGADAGRFLSWMGFYKDNSAININQFKDFTILSKIYNSDGKLVLKDFQFSTIQSAAPEEKAKKINILGELAFSVKDLERRDEYNVTIENVALDELFPQISDQRTQLQKSYKEPSIVQYEQEMFLNKLFWINNINKNISLNLNFLNSTMFKKNIESIVLSAKAQYSKVNIENLSISSNFIQGEAATSIDMSLAKPKIKLIANFKTLDINSLMDITPLKKNELLSKSDYKIPSFDSINASIDLKLSNFSYRENMIENMIMTADLAEGSITLQELVLDIFDGKVLVNGSLNVKSVPGFMNSFTVSNVNLSKLLKHFEIDGVLGYLNATGSIFSSGFSPYSVLTNAKGEAQIDISSFSIKNSDMFSLVRALLFTDGKELLKPNKIKQLLSSGPGTTFNSCKGKLLFNDGILTLYDIILKSQGIGGVVVGQVNVPENIIDLSARYTLAAIDKDKTSIKPVFLSTKTNGSITNSTITVDDSKILEHVNSDNQAN